MMLLLSFLLVAQDTLRLTDLQDAALARDPRAAQGDLLAAQSGLRLASLGAERLPQFSVNGEATHQSDVTSIAGMPFQPPRDQWRATAGAQQLLYDGGAIAARRDVERARLAESLESARVTQYRLLFEVNGAFFSAFLLQERRAELASLLADLGERLAVVRARVREGAALPGDTAAIQAEILRATLADAEVAASRRASLAVLRLLTGAEVDDDADVFALPDIATAQAEPARPELAQFARIRDRLASEAALAFVERRPRVVAFGQAGLGRPGLNMFDTGVNDLWLAGVRVEWRPWTWGNTTRQQEVLRLQQRIMDTEEAAFRESLARAVQSDLQEMRRLEDALDTDDRIIALREQVERQARVQLDEGAITVAEYVDARGALLEARVARQLRGVQLAQARARYLTTLGIRP